MSEEAKNSGKLEQKLGLLDVYAISTGAMFASGFFLLPGVAAATAGPSVILAYLVSAILMVPSTLAIAELSTAMPRAGGPYFFIDRGFGALMGTVGGVGAWLVLVLKSAFALVGMGAYLTLFFDVAIEPVAVGFTLAFAALNIVGAKESAWLQVSLVVGLVALMAAYVAGGLWFVGELGFGHVWQEQMTPFFPFGADGLLTTVGMVFVSYAGLTKVASVSEEVREAERNVPLGMALALLTVTFIYVAGVYVMVAVLPPQELRDSLTPVADAGQRFLGWLPEPWALVGVVVVAMAAFASTGNAGVLAASRMPMAMARDGVALAGLGKVGRKGTPTRSVLLTAGAMIAVILVLDVESLARLASAFLLLVFALLNLTVIVMRESHIESYVPGFRMPLYPWTPIAGILLSLGLIAVLGWFYVGFLAAVVVVSLLWYAIYVRRRVPNRGAIYTLFERLAAQRHDALEEEFWTLLKERGPTEEDLFDRVVAQAGVIDIEGLVDFSEVVERAAERLAEGVPVDARTLAEWLRQSGGHGGPPVTGEAVLLDLRIPAGEHPHLVMVRLQEGVARRSVCGVVSDDDDDDEQCRDPAPVVRAALFLVSPASRTSQHLRILAALSARIDDPSFVDLWQDARSDHDLREIFLRSERFLLLRLHDPGPTREVIGQRAGELRLPKSAIVAAIHRNGSAIELHPEQVLQEHDRLAIVGRPAAIEKVRQRYGAAIESSVRHAGDPAPGGS